MQLLAVTIIASAALYAILRLRRTLARSGLAHPGIKGSGGAGQGSACGCSSCHCAGQPRADFRCGCDR